MIAHDVEFIIVGGFAVAFHGFPRATIGIDIWVKRSPENAAKIHKVISAFGFGESLKDPQLLLLPGKIFRMGLAPNRIELLNDIDGVDFDVCSDRKVIGSLDGVTVPFISREDLRVNKQASGRYEDLNDSEQLP